VLFPKRGITTRTAQYYLPIPDISIENKVLKATTKANNHMVWSKNDTILSRTTKYGQSTVINIAKFTTLIILCKQQTQIKIT
jgi:hypothetical protein